MKVLKVRTPRHPLKINTNTNLGVITSVEYYTRWSATGCKSKDIYKYNILNNNKEMRYGVMSYLIDKVILN